MHPLSHQAGPIFPSWWKSTPQSGHCESNLYTMSLLPPFPYFLKSFLAKSSIELYLTLLTLQKYKSLPLEPQLPPPCYYRSTHSVMPQGWDHFGKETLTHGTTESRSQILGQNLDKSFKKFPSCNSQSHLQLCLEIYISWNARNLLQFLQFSYCTL
jgi:hypothetical protein